MATVRISYESLKNWQRENRLTYQSMAEAAKDRGAKIHAETIGAWISQGRPMPGDVILAWRDAYAWTWEQMLHYCLGGPAHLLYTPKPITSEQRQLLAAFDALIEARR